MSHSDIKVRFALHPGMVKSPNDGDYHYISFRQLCDLYGIDPREAVWVEHGSSRSHYKRGVGVDLDCLLHLYPSDMGARYWHISELERSLYPISVKS